MPNLFSILPKVIVLNIMVICEGILAFVELKFDTNLLFFIEDFNYCNNFGVIVEVTVVFGALLFR